MKIEIVDFYPYKTNKEGQYLQGNLRIYLIDQQMDILGVYVQKIKDKWFFRLPSGKGTDHETNKPVRFPLVSFTDRNKNKELMTAIRSKGKDYIQKNHADLL